MNTFELVSSSVEDQVRAQLDVPPAGLGAGEGRFIGDRVVAAEHHLIGDVKDVGVHRFARTPARAKRRPVAVLAGDDAFARPLSAAKRASNAAWERDLLRRAAVH